jgi:hypothetical protein
LQSRLGERPTRKRSTQGKVPARREPVPMRWKIITWGVGRLDGPGIRGVVVVGRHGRVNGGGGWMRSVGGMAGSSWRRGNPQQQRSSLLPGLSVVSSSRRAAIGENRLLRDAIKAAAVGLAHTFLAWAGGRSNVCLPEKQAKTARSLPQKCDTGRRNFNGPSPKTS